MGWRERLGAAHSGAGNARELSLALRSERQTGADILTRELGEVRENLVLAHSSGEVAEHVTDGETCPPDGGLSKTDLRIDDNALTVAHVRTLPPTMGRVNLHASSVAAYPSPRAPSRYGVPLGMEFTPSGRQDPPRAVSGLSVAIQPGESGRRGVDGRQ